MKKFLFIQTFLVCTAIELLFLLGTVHFSSNPSLTNEESGVLGVIVLVLIIKNFFYSIIASLLGRKILYRKYIIVQFVLSLLLLIVFVPNAGNPIMWYAGLYFLAIVTLIALRLNANDKSLE
jgi:hypothetical protein